MGRRAQHRHADRRQSQRGLLGLSPAPQVPSKPASPSPWWQRAVIYQIYPRSFQDTNGDGVGDLPGVIARLGYLAELGVDAIWLSPIFRSPMRDFGYDISDYRDVDPLFGTLDDLDRLMEAAHRRGLKILLDFVPNHTSDQHPWFVESRASRGSAKRDWYIWRDPAPGGGPPNNWLSEFGGSAWELDRATGQYYYHAFLAAQPDLNWRNPAVVAAMHDVMRFWLARGVDGFRVDVMWHLMKDGAFRDNPENPRWQPGMQPHQRVLPLYSADFAGVLDIVAGLRRVVDEFDERLLIGEIYLPIERLVAYYGENLQGAHLPFNFALLQTPWNARDIAHLVRAYEDALPPGGWPNWVLGNHDRPRIASRVGRAQARVAAILLLTLRGTPTLYYGDELGMEQVTIPPERVRDPWEKNVPGQGRDGARTPMQWDCGPHAGFSEAEPWLPLSDDAASSNVAIERADPSSMLGLYVRLLRIRRARPVLQLGAFQSIAARDGVLLYARALEEERILVALNLSGAPVTLEAEGTKGIVLASSFAHREGETVNGRIELKADDGLVIDLARESAFPHDAGPRLA
jgi:alpha-glucosidase